MAQFGGDESCEKEAQSIVSDYEYVFGELAADALNKVPLAQQPSCSDGKVANRLISQQVYPLDSIQSETSWTLDHALNVKNKASSHCSLSNHVEELLNRCFPSRLLRKREIPTRMIKLNSSYNFRAILMPQRRYFSF